MVSKYKKIFFSIFLPLVIIAGCAGKDIKKSKTPEELYKEGMALYQKAPEKSFLFRNQYYLKALKSFQEIKEKYPYSQSAILAELRVADCHFKMKGYEEAIASYQDFLKLHPTNENIPYVIFQLGLCYFDQILTIDRDQTMTYRAIKEFEYLITYYPKSKYVQESWDKINICRERLAQHEFYVGEFYFKNENYSAALKRFEGILKNYPSMGLDDQAYQYVQECNSFIQKKK